MFAHGMSKDEVGRITQLSESFLFRLRQSPLFQQMIQEEKEKIRLAREMKREQEGLEAARAERPYDVGVLLDLAEFSLLRDFVEIRDRSQNVEFKLKACVEMNKQLARIRDQNRAGRG
jgi:hypothetical protein